jgi:flagellar biosynthesis protein FlhG
MDELKNKFWAIGGGKGGVGKSIVSLMLGASLSRQGKKVILVDADLGGSNLHTLTGIRYPMYTLADFINKEVELIDNVIIDTPIDNMRLICGADDILGIANPKYAQKTRIFNALKKLDADYIILDLGAGTSFTSVDFFLYAPNKIVVLTPQVTSIQNAYGFIKASLYRRLNNAFKDYPECVELIKRASASGKDDQIDSVDKLKEALHSIGDEHSKTLTAVLDELNIKIILNMVRETKEKEVATIVSTVAQNYLSLPIEILGNVQYDNVLGMSINHMAKFLTGKRDSVSNMCFYDIAGKVIRTMMKMSNNNLPDMTATAKPEVQFNPVTPSGTAT